MGDDANGKLLKHWRCFIDQFGVKAHAVTSSIFATRRLSVRRHRVGSRRWSSGHVCGARGDADPCKAGLENILPGEYYACRAKYHLDRDHPGSAVSMLKEAAYWANKNAQHFLGVAYFNGGIPGIPADRPLGIAWLALATERKEPDFVRAYTSAVVHSAPTEQQQAGQLFLQLRKQYGDAAAGPRAWHRFERGMQPMDEAIDSDGGGVTCLAGFGQQNTFVITKQLRDQAIQDFAGLKDFDRLHHLYGTVSVGALQNIPAPAANASSAPSGK